MRWAMVVAGAWIGGLAGCAPLLDWREVRPEGSDVVALFPCKPDRVERDVPLGDRRVRMRMLSCGADGMTFALSGAELGEPSRVAPALETLRATAAANFAASAVPAGAAKVPGATPNPQSGRVRLDGRRPDGAAVVAHTVFFVRGTVVWQATVLGPAPAAEAVETFVAGLQAGR